jgi:hypothetical protein
MWVYPKKEKKQSFFHRLKESLGGASNENTKNQKVQAKGIQRQTKNPNRENS